MKLLCSQLKRTLFKKIIYVSSKPLNFSVLANFSDCDLYHGKWVYDSAGPLYSNNSCPVLTQMQNCQGNGRPDKEYENWRWKPAHCDLPRFDTKKFLELMRGKTLAFIGDSVARNQMESLLCILWQASIRIFYISIDTKMLIFGFSTLSCVI